MTPRPDDWLFDTLNRLEATQTRHASEIRTEMRAGFDRLGKDLQAHEVEDRALANDVLIIKTQRASEAAQAFKRSSFISILTASGVTGLFKVVDHFFK